MAGRAALPPLLVSLLFCACASPAAELEFMYWFPSLDMQAKASGEGTRVDFKDDLGVSDQGFPGGRLRWFTGDYGWIQAEYMGSGYSESTTLDRDIYWKGKRFKAGTPVETDLSMEFARIGWAWPFLSVGDGTLKIGSLVEARRIDIETEIKAEKKFKTHEDTVKIRETLPALGVVFDLNPQEIVNMYLQASGFYVGNRGYLYDVEAGMKIVPVRYLSMTAGYRLMSLDFEDADDEVSVRLNGFFLAASVRF